MYTEDGYFVQQCLHGDSAAFGFLVDKYKACVFSLAYAKLGNFHDAQDIAQEVFIRVYQKLDTFKPSEKFKPWLYVITSNLCIDFLRKQSKRPDCASIETVDVTALNSMTVTAHQRKFQHETIHAALSELPEIYRTTLTLYYLGGMKNREIAEFLGTSKNTVESRLRRARAKLKQEMIAMIQHTFDNAQLQPGFTFRVVEVIKRAKLQPTPPKSALPFGVSVTAGLIAILLSMSVFQHHIYPIGELLGFPLSGKAQSAEVGVIPVDVIESTNAPILASETGEGNFGQKPKLQEKLKLLGVAGKWTQKKDLPTGRNLFETCVVDGKIYAIGGYDDTKEKNKNLATLEVYDPATDTWTKKFSMPTARSGHGVCVVDGKIYVLGGWRNGTHLVFTLDAKFQADLDNEKASPEFRELFAKNGLDPTTIDADDKNKAKWYVVDEIRKNYYVVEKEDGKLKVYDASPLKTVEVYDPAADMWSKLTDMPTGRANFPAVALDGKVYAIGGSGAHGYSHTMEIFNPATGKWTHAAPMPIGRNQFTAREVNGKIYVAGGETEYKPCAVTLAYDPMTDSWSRKADIPTFRNWPTMSVIDAELYVIGGWNFSGKFASTVEAYNPKTDSWTEKFEIASQRWGASASVVDNVLYLIGGGVDDDGVKNLALVEAYSLKE